MQPLLLAPDQLTSPARTPWGGTRLARTLKRGLVAEALSVGESWELSWGPEFASRLDGEARTLAEALSAAPDALGREAALGGTALLVKFVDAARALSVQIHPRDDDPALSPGESGKPEAWYVEHAAAGAGVWLGLVPGVARGDVERCLARGDDLSACLSFVPLEEGDFVLVPPGTPHAIGAGLTLVEPQRVRPGCVGVTYRYWDWNRRYDDEGREAADGRPRPLHVERALAVTEWDAPRGDAALAKVRLRAGAPALAGPVRVEPLAGTEGLASDALEVARLAGTGHGAIPPSSALRALTVLEGVALVDGVRVERGRTAALPAGASARTVDAVGLHAIVAAAR